MVASAEDILDVRVLIPDTDAIYGPGQDENLFTDDDITRFFRLGRDSALRGAGLAMIAVGNSEQLISKVIVTEDLETDGAKVADMWRKAGEDLIVQANQAGAFWGFELVELTTGRPPELTEPFTGEWPYGY
jgi:hypothetical protein